MGIFNLFNKNKERPKRRDERPRQAAEKPPMDEQTRREREERLKLDPEVAFQIGNEKVQNGELAEGIKYWNAACRNGHIEAGVSSGRAYYEAGFFSSAEMYLETAVAKKHPEALFLMGEIYRRGNTEVPQDSEKAIRFYSQAAEAGKTEAALALEQLHKELQQAEKDSGFDEGDKEIAAPESLQPEPQKEYISPLSEAELALQAAIDAYRAEAWVVALTHFEEAAALGHARAAYIAAELYLLPELLDFEQAEKWAEKAKQAGEPNAAALLHRIRIDAADYYYHEAEQLEFDYLYSHTFEQLHADVHLQQEKKVLIKRMLEYLGRDAEQGHSWSMVQIAHYLFWNHFDNDEEWIERQHL